MMNDTLWITYSAHYSTSLDPREGTTTTYSNVALFDDELEALRFANDHGCKAVPTVPGIPLEDAIKNKASRERGRSAG